MGETEGGTGNEALVQRLRNNQQWEKTGFNHDLVKDAADALERQQADIQRKDEAFESAVAQISEYGARMDNMEAVVRVVRSMDRRGLLGKELRDALAALDAAPEGDG